MKKAVNTIIREELQRFLNEPIIDINGTYRNVNGIITEVKQDEGQLSDILSDDNIAAIKKLGGLSGESDFLGSGSEGSAYRFNDKVLKITKDQAEAHGTSIIAGKSHPNVYTVHMAYNLPRNVFKKRVGPYMIIYDYLDYPSNAMAEVVNHLDSMIKASSDSRIVHKTFYFWEESNIKKITSLAKELLRGTKDYKFESVDRKLRSRQKYELIADSLRWSKEDRNLMYSMLVFFGSYSGFDSHEKLQGLVGRLVGSDKFKHLTQLASGLSFLKSNGIEFDDLKTGNIMQKDGQIVIIDIGKSGISGGKPVEKLNL